METTRVIPNKFTLAGADWKVVYVDTLNEMGHCNPETHTVALRGGMSKQATEQTFCHELIHALLFTAGHTNHDEIFVDALGSLMHQWLKTAK